MKTLPGVRPLPCLNQISHRSHRHRSVDPFPNIQTPSSAPRIATWTPEQRVDTILGYAIAHGMTPLNPSMNEHA